MADNQKNGVSGSDLEDFGPPGLTFKGYPYKYNIMPYLKNDLKYKYRVVRTMVRTRVPWYVQL